MRTICGNRGNRDMTLFEKMRERITLAGTRLKPFINEKTPAFAEVYSRWGAVVAEVINVFDRWNDATMYFTDLIKWMGSSPFFWSSKQQKWTWPHFLFLLRWCRFKNSTSTKSPMRTFRSLRVSFWKNNGRRSADLYNFTMHISSYNAIIINCQKNFRTYALDPVRFSPFQSRADLP